MSILLGVLGGSSQARLSQSSSKETNHSEKEQIHDPEEKSVTKPFHNENNTLCDIVNTDLPEECLCRDHNLGMMVDCVKVFNSTFLNDTIGMRLDFDPCDPVAAHLSLDVTEKNHNIDYPISQIAANEEHNYPIPGLAVHIPGVMNLGLDVDVLLEGNIDQLTVKVGLNACAGIHNHQVCAESLPILHNILPWWILNGTYSFGDACENNFVVLEEKEEHEDERTAAGPMMLETATS